MKTAEKTGRFLFVLFLLLCALILTLPCRGITVDIVLSGSMEPGIKTGGIVFTDTTQVEPEPGDIITYKLGETFVTHRVIRKEKEKYITKGDANDREDALPVSESQVRGTVVFALPWLGYLAALLKQKTVFMILALMIVQEIIFGMIRWKGERRKSLRGKII